MRFLKSPRAGPDAQETDRSFPWSLAGALLASLCCVGPLVAILVAGGTAAGAVGLVRFKYEFIAAGLVVTLVGIGLSLRKSRASCSVKTYQHNRILIPTVSLLTFLAVVVGSNLLLLNDRIIDVASSRLSHDANQDTVQMAAPLAHQLDVEITSGVYCPACLLAIQKGLSDTPGVSSADFVDSDEGEFVARIVYDPTRVDQATLLTTIARTPGALGGAYGTKTLRDGPAT